MSKNALITGITGQDGSYLAELLLEKGYEVHGIARDKDSDKANLCSWTDDVFSNTTIHEGDITNYERIKDIISTVRPDEIYDLAAIVSPHVDPATEFSIVRTNSQGIHNILASVREIDINIKVYFAASSLVFGNPDVSPQNEDTPFKPVTPYGIAKATGFFLAKMYREKYNIFTSSGILYTHESPRRDSRFLFKKITEGVAKIKLGIEKSISLGDIDAKRDWGFAGDYVKAMWLSLQQDEPGDYVIGTGEAHTVRDVLDVAFGIVGLDWNEFINIDPKFIRAPEPVTLVADNSRAKKVLGWSPNVRFEELVRMMVEHDLKNIKISYE